MTSTASSVTLLRPEAGPPWSAVDIVGAVPVALTAGFESRAEARVGQVAWDLAERWSSLLPVEATCTICSSARPRLHTQVGVVLLDRRFPIWLVVPAQHRRSPGLVGWPADAMRAADGRAEASTTAVSAIALDPAPGGSRRSRLLHHPSTPVLGRGDPVRLADWGCSS